MEVGHLILRYETNLPTGEGALCDSEAPTASSSEEQLQMEWKKQNTHQDGEVMERGKDYKASVGNEEEHAGPQQPESQTVLILSFSEDQSFSKTSFGENQNVSGDEHSLLDSTHPESNMEEICEVSKVTEQSGSELLSLEDDEKIDDSSSMEEGIEPSTDEELRLWRYPQHNVYKDEELNIADRQEGTKDEEEALTLSRVEKESGGHVVNDSDHSDTQGGDFDLSNVSVEIGLEDDKAGPEADEFESDVKCVDDSMKDQSPLNRDQENIESYKGCNEGAATEDTDTFTTRQDQKQTEEHTHVDDVCQHSKEIQTVNIKEEDMDLESVRTGPNSTEKQMEASPFSDVTRVLKETQTGHTDVQRKAEVVAQLDTKTYADIDAHGAAQSVTEAQTSEHILETEEMEQEAVDEGKSVTDGLTEEETHKAEGRESSKKVTFILEPELINDTNNSAESRTETSTSGENSKKM